MGIEKQNERLPLYGVVLTLLSERLKAVTVVDLGPESINPLLFRGLVAT